jgi:hypothetical protein
MCEDAGVFPLIRGADRFQDLVGIAVFARGLLGVDEVPVHYDLEHAAARRDQLQIGYLVLELFE